MKEKCKKVLSILLSMAMLISITAGINLSAYALLSSGQCGENVTYTLDESTGLLTISGTGDMYDYGWNESPFSNGSIKTVVIEDKVTRIGTYTFYECSNLTSVTIPNSVTSIGSSAFEDCTSLTSITIPDSVKAIGDSAFSYCSSLTSITIPDSVMSIGDCAFSNCSSLTSVTIPNSVTSIGDSAFYECSSLTSITIPDSVKAIGDSAFSHCSSLTSVIIGNGVINIGDYAFYDCSSLTSVIIGNGVTNIGDYAFDDCSSLQRVNISSIEAWCDISFSNSNSNPLYWAGNLYLNDELVTDLVIPNSITSIKDYAFYDCSSLTSITIPDSVTSIGNGAFEFCDNLTSVTIPNSVTSIGDHAFEGCINLRTVFYSGSKSEWLNISRGEGNEPLTEATIHFNSTGDHTWDSGKITKQPTCTENGEKVYTCTDCGTIKTKTLQNLGGHKYNNKVVAPTCTAKGYTKHTCSKCGRTYKDKYANALGHNNITTKTKATASKDGSIDYKCARCGKKYKQSVVIPKASNIKLSATSYTYNGKVKTPSVTVKDSKGKTLKKNTDYTVTYDNGRKKIGKYAVKINFKGNYSGSKTLYFKIVPKGTSLKSVSATMQGFKVNWKKQAAQTTGYQIQYSTSKNFDSPKSYTTKNTKTLSKTFSKLSNRTTYYIRIRTYKKVGDSKYYSDWSKSLKVKTKGINDIGKVTFDPPLIEGLPNDFVAKWDKVSGVTGYQIKYTMHGCGASKSKTVKLSQSKTSYAIHRPDKYDYIELHIRTYKTVKEGNKTVTYYGKYKDYTLVNGV